MCYLPLKQIKLVHISPPPPPPAPASPLLATKRLGLNI